MCSTYHVGLPHTMLLLGGVGGDSNGAGCALVVVVVATAEADCSKGGTRVWPMNIICTGGGLEELFRENIMLRWDEKKNIPVRI